MNKSDFEFYIHKSCNNVITIENCIATNSSYIIIAEKELIINDIEITIYGYGETLEEARKNVEQKIEKYNIIIK